MRVNNTTHDNQTAPARQKSGTNPLLALLRHHVTGAIERGEAQAIVAREKLQFLLEYASNPFEISHHVPRERVAYLLRAARSRWGARNVRCHGRHSYTIVDANLYLYLA